MSDGDAPPAPARRALDARALAVALAVVGGAALGEAAWRGGVRQRSHQPPPGWVEEPGDVPYQLAELARPLPVRSDSWTLDFYQTVRPTEPHLAEAPTPVEATVTLPPDGQLEVWIAAPEGLRGNGGVGLLVERVGEPDALVFRQTRGRLEPLRCDGTLAVPDTPSFRVALLPEPNGVRANVGDASVVCTARLPAAGPALRPGLRAVQVRDLRLGQQTVPGPGPQLRPLWWLAGALLSAGLVGLELWLGARAVLVALTTLPLLLALPLETRDLRLWAETARVTWLPVAWLGALLPAVATGLAKATHLLGRALHEPEERRRDWPLAAAVGTALPIALAFGVEPGALGEAPAGAAALAGCAAVAAALPALLGRLGSTEPRRVTTLIASAGAASAVALSLLDTTHRAAVIGAATATLGWGLLTWAQANAHRVRFYNVASLAAVVLTLYGLEGAVRGTRAGMQWSATGARTSRDDIYGWVGQVNEDLDLLDEGTHRDYPDRGFPAAVPGGDGRTRIVAMGGSTTGGAYQNDDLDEFYPARLGELLGPGVQVVNQGVGGWTTFHIHRYVQDRLDALDPDVLTLYIGHNDLLTPVPVPVADLYAARDASPTTRRISDGLRRVLLYQGLRYLLTSVRPAGRRVAVPIEDARRYIEDMADALEARGGHLVLASEGLSPDPAPLAAYNHMLAEVAAERDGVSYVDVAGALHSQRADRLFIDDCHLTDSGHRFVARVLARHLREQGLVEDHEQP